uniref:Coiled-coil domain containing 148 n=1 Tax=Sinocyclocheilus anshuiensis TaxID=1608454 RepID=A0A671PEU3_9TELE
MQCECVSLQQDICVTELKNLLSAAMEDQVAYLEKVPDEIFIVDCPYPELQSDLIHSFNSLTEKYKLRLAIVETRLQGLDRNCGWNAADHECFQHIMSQYSPSLRNQRSLYIDMLQRMLPHISKQELSAHERQSDWYHFSISQKNLILQGWQRDHSELLLRALNMLEDCIISHIQQQEVQKQRSHQQNICLKLRAKVFTFNILRYCHTISSSILMTFISINKLLSFFQINRFNADKQRKQEMQRKKDMERLAELRRELEEQLCLFVCFKVSKVAEANPERMMGNTVAWRVRQQPEEVFTLQRPLYQLNTYTDTQIVSDPRVRIEQVLRTAGLHNTPYARQILSEIQPLKPPRRDMESAAFRT